MASARTERVADTIATAAASMSRRHDRTSRSPSPEPKRRRQSRERDDRRPREDDHRRSTRDTRDTTRATAIPDRDRERAAERAKQMEYDSAVAESAPPKPVFDPVKEQEIMALTTRTGGAYIPPARLRAMQAQIQDKSGEAYQRMSWEALKKSINGLINKVR